MVNVGMILGILSLLNATLTLPGVAGIVTIGAIDAGFGRALATILDSNITIFIAAAVLFFIESGPVRGFAVTLAVGVVTTIFSAFTLTRLIVALLGTLATSTLRADLSEYRVLGSAEGPNVRLIRAADANTGIEAPVVIFSG